MIKSLRKRIPSIEETIKHSLLGLTDARSNRLIDAAKFYEDHMNFAIYKWRCVQDQIITTEMETWFQ